MPRFFNELFPGGLQSQALLDALAPEGWVMSALRLAFHPPDEVLEEEGARITKNLEELTKGLPKREKPVKRSKELDDMFARIQMEIEEMAAAQPESDDTECAPLVGLCLWDVFSDNQEVIAPDSLDEGPE